MNPKEYIDLRLEQARLKGSDLASTALGGALAWFLIISIGIIFLTLLAFGIVLLLGKVLDNYALGAFIVCGVFLLLLVILYACRKVLFRGKFVRLLSGKNNYEELRRSEELAEIRVKDANLGFSSSGIGSIVLRTGRILLRLLLRK